MRALITTSPGQSVGELAGLLNALATDLGMPGTVATDTSGPRMAFRVPPQVYDAWLSETGVNAADAPPEPVATKAAAYPPAAATEPGAAVEGSAAPTTKKTRAKA